MKDQLILSMTDPRSPVIMTISKNYKIGNYKYQPKDKTNAAFSFACWLSNKRLEILPKCITWLV